MKFSPLQLLIGTNFVFGQGGARYLLNKPPNIWKNENHYFLHIWYMPSTLHVISYWDMIGYIRACIRVATLKEKETGAQSVSHPRSQSCKVKELSFTLGLSVSQGLDYTLPPRHRWINTSALKCSSRSRASRTFYHSESPLVASYISKTSHEILVLPVHTSDLTEEECPRLLGRRLLRLMLDTALE